MAMVMVMGLKLMGMGKLRSIPAHLYLASSNGRRIKDSNQLAAATDSSFMMFLI